MSESNNMMDAQVARKTENEEAMDQDEAEPTPNREVYLPGKALEDGEELVCDQTAYVMLHQAQTGAPCLSFDIIKDNFGENRDTYPLTCYLVAGTQAAQVHVNSLIVMKLSNLHRTTKESDEDDDESDDDNEEEEEDDSKDPQMAAALIKHEGCINRTRCTNIGDTVVAASWSELGRVNTWDLSQQLEAVNNSTLLSRYNKENKGGSIKPLYTFNGHQQEGFALDWNTQNPGVLASGDCKMDIHIWHLKEAATWNVDQRPLVGHTKSVEDLQWSPNEPTVLASCSIDKSIRIWDIRAAPSKACMLVNHNAHTSDVNVISWNRNEPFIVSGGDDGFLHVWDLRRFKDTTPVATFKHHTEPITTVDWHPTDSAVFASGGSDHQIALWDLSVERDVEALGEEIADLPPQLLFIHQGQTDIKELRWHPQIPGVIISTAQSGFNVFRTISI